MIKNTHWVKQFIFIMTVAITFILPGIALSENDENFDIVIQLGDIENSLMTLDELIASSGKGEVSLTDTVSSMFGGLDWIDSSKSVVIGAAFYGSEPDVTVFIPTLTENEQIVSQYNATKGDNYYIFKPLNTEISVTSEEKKSLEEISTLKRNGFFSIKIAISGLMEKNRGSIMNGIDSIDQQSSGSQPQTMGPSPEEMKDLLKNMVDMTDELSSITLGFDLISNDLVTYFDMQAKEETDLFFLFTKKHSTGILPNFSSNYQIIYKSLPMDYKKFMDMFDKVFGSFYASMGIDLKSMNSILSRFTGEQSGGMSITDNGIRMGSISVMNEVSDNFIETQLMPLILKTGASMSEALGKSMNKPVVPYFRKGQTTQVSGQAVYGVIADNDAINLNQSQGIHTPAIEEMRLATYKNYLLIASDDQEMENLISKADDIKLDGIPSKLYEIDMDLGGYMSSMMQYMAGPDAQIGFPITDRITMDMDADNGKLTSRTQLNIEDLKNMTDFFATFDPEILVRKDEMSADSELDTSSNRKVSFRKKEYDPDTDAEYWTDKAGLVSTYGNHKMAVAYYNKAIKLNPDHSDAYFYQGVSYGELGHYSKAVSSITKALSLDPGNGKYYYGRGRVFLISGDELSAEYDFIKAAELKHPDALDYISKQMN